VKEEQMKRRTMIASVAVAAVVSGMTAAGMAVSQAAETPAVAPTTLATLAVAGGAPYIYSSVSGTRDPVAVMQSTGVKAFTLAFILNSGNCSPVWDSGTLNDASKTALISKIRAAGGDVVVSFGGASGDKLGNACADETALAAAYQKVIDQFQLRAIDIDLEAGEVSQSLKVLKALKIIKQNNAAVSTIITLPTGTEGLVGSEVGIPAQAASIGSPVDNWTIMPFDFGGNDASLDHGAATVSASEGLHSQLKSALGGTDAEIYALQGISSMNGQTDTGGNVTVANFQTMLAYAQQHGLTRFTYWELSRDTATLDFTKVIGQFTA
jgi:chitinase